MWADTSLHLVPAGLRLELLMLTTVHSILEHFLGNLTTKRHGALGRMQDQGEIDVKNQSEKAIAQ